MERLAAPRRPVEIEQRLRTRLGFAVQLAISEHAAPAAILPSRGVLQVRVPPALLAAPDEVLDALARFARAPFDLEAWALLLDFTDAAPEREDGGEDEARGAVHDLAAIFTEINARYFQGRVAARISWSRGSAERRRHSILFGSYFRAPGDEVGTIKIHPALDQPWVPRGFVEFVVHHECLHAVVPTRSVNGRRAFHPPEFRRRERQYPEFWKWRRWEKENLSRFLGKRKLTPSEDAPTGASP